MPSIIAINPVDPAHLSAVADEMTTRGAPHLRAIRIDGDLWLAFEGSHRLAAAQQLGLEPVLVEVDEDDMLSCAEIGYDDMGWFDGEPARAGDIRDRIGSPDGTFEGCPIFRFGE